MKLSICVIVCLISVCANLSDGFVSCRRQAKHQLFSRALHILRDKSSATVSNAEVTQVAFTKTWSLEPPQVDTTTTIKLISSGNSPVPRPYAPSILVVGGANDCSQDSFFGIAESSLAWYLDRGGRIGRLEMASSADSTISQWLQQMGFQIIVAGDAASQSEVPPDLRKLRQDVSSLGSPHSLWSANASSIIQHCQQRILAGKGDAYLLNDIIGRLYHDIGQPQLSIDFYTKALQAYSTSPAGFRNLGSAYHAIGNKQMAFASYQQSLQLDSRDGLTYLKLALFYEEYAAQDWLEAADNAVLCYKYYLDNVDSEDTSVLTRLGNLLVREHRSEKAIAVYNRVLAVDPNATTAWFNKAHAEMKVGDFTGAAASLKRTLQLDPSIAAARHMLRALSEDEAVNVNTSEDDYIKDLFNSYAPSYDEHGKKLLYSAPRIIRQEMSKIYKAKMTTGEIENYEDVKPAVEELEFEGKQQEDENDIASDRVSREGGGFSLCSSHSLTKVSTSIGDDAEAKAEGAASTSGTTSIASYQSFLNRSLEILDLGCGTGLAGAWLKDYAKTLIGVDISEQMVNAARKKMLYQELYVMPINEYLSKSKRKFDLVVAADVVSYIGDLTNLFPSIVQAIKPGGHFVFTAEAASEDSVLAQRGFRLLRNGRFGYSKSYLDSAVQKLGYEYKIELARDFSPRLDAGVPAPGYLYIIEKAE